jgi:hypothetical protein
MADEFQQIEAPVTVKVSYLVCKVTGSANKTSTGRPDVRFRSIRRYALRLRFWIH